MMEPRVKTAGVASAGALKPEVLLLDTTRVHAIRAGIWRRGPSYTMADIRRKPAGRTRPRRRPLEPA
jgi:hypothetical protein